MTPGNLQCENVSIYNPEKTRMEGQFGDVVLFSKVATKTVERKPCFLILQLYTSKKKISKCTLTDGPGTWKFVKMIMRKAEETLNTIPL